MQTASNHTATGPSDDSWSGSALRLLRDIGSLFDYVRRNPLKTIALAVVASVSARELLREEVESVRPALRGLATDVDADVMNRITVPFRQERGLALGDIVGSRFQVNVDTSGFQCDPAVVAATSGKLFVAYRSNAADSDKDPQGDSGIAGQHGL